MRRNIQMAEANKKKVLIVDDQPNWREVLSDLLQNQYEVKSVERFEEAKTEIFEPSYDLLLLDVRLEDDDRFNHDGIELLKIAKQELLTKVILITGYRNSIREEILKKYKPDGLFVKNPHTEEGFNRDSFLQKVESLLNL